MTSFDSHFTMTIGGQSVDGAATFGVLNPATEEVLAQAPDCSAAQLDQAVAAARRAFPAWRALTMAQRREYLMALPAAILKHSEPLAQLLSREQGKSLADARTEIGACGQWLQAQSQLELPVVVNEDSAERRSETRRVPLGVVAALSPWNFPVLLAYWKVMPALLAGNTALLKPSPFTPLTVLKIGELVREALPPGVFNVITGGDALGPMVTAHPGIDKVSFTGSTETGKRVMESAAATLKRVTLELGGNDAAIVLPDVDVKAVAPQIFWLSLINNGQTCIAIKRIYVHRDIYAEMANALAEIARTVKVGNGQAEGTQLGPVQNRKQFERVVGMLDEAKAQGLQFLVGGEAREGKGYFIPPTFVDNPPDDARIVREEVFGPVRSLLKYCDIDEAIARANDSPYGLGASVWSSDIAKAQAVADRLEAGSVWINEAAHLSPMVSFAGHKQSGIGIENGVDGMLEYTAAQTRTVRKPPAAAAAT
ncbi:MAG: aldehyde dehydrogenase family protein [Burkholderiales bacterium]